MEKNKETDNILNSLDGLQKASAGHFFYTRVHSRLQKEEMGSWGRLAYFITKPSIALATLFLIFLLNAAAFFYHKASSSGIAAKDLSEQLTTDDYNTTLAANSYYDENTETH